MPLPINLIKLRIYTHLHKDFERVPPWILSFSQAILDEAFCREERGVAVEYWGKS